MQKVALILLGAGDSTRFKTKRIPKKQWLRVGEIPLWLKVAQEVSSFYPFSQCIITTDKNSVFYMQKYLDSLPFKVIIGGKTRQESLQNALKEVKEDFVLVSDVARCNIPKEIFTAILEKIGDFDCVAPYLDVSDTIALDEENLSYLKREKIKLIQTPQLSKTELLKKSLKLGEFTDESSAICANGGKIGFIKGSQESKKITHISDLQSLNLPKTSKRAIIGNGSDIHALSKGNGMILGGIKIPCEYSLIAHSDGDVCLHALSDALLGAIGAGDIGEWFPDNDTAYKGADSSILLKKIVDFTYDVGYSIKQADITLFAQKPKLSPYKKEMEKNIANILEIPNFCVNVKATTTEKLGFIGREEGIFVQASVLLEYFDLQSLRKGEL